MKILILKFNIEKNNYWGNDKRMDGVGFQTFPSIAQQIMDITANNGTLYMCHAGNGYGVYGPMKCELNYEKKDGFYFFELKGNLHRPVTGFLPHRQTTEMLTKLHSGAAGVLISDNRLTPLYLKNDQWKELQIPGVFSLKKDNVVVNNKITSIQKSGDKFYIHFNDFNEFIKNSNVNEYIIEIDGKGKHPKGIYTIPKEDLKKLVVKWEFEKDVSWTNDKYRYYSLDKIPRGLENFFSLDIKKVA